MKIQFPRKLIEELHSKIHELTDGKKARHKADYYSYFCGYFVKEVREMRKELKEVSKQQKYLWQTLNKIIEKGEIK